MPGRWPVSVLAPVTIRVLLLRRASAWHGSVDGMSQPAVDTSPQPARAGASRAARTARAALVVLGLLVVTPVLVIGLALLGHWASERPQVARINQSLQTVEHDLRDVAAVVHSYPAEARAFVCCGDGGPSGSLILRGTGDLPSTIKQAHAHLVATGWTISDLSEDGSWFTATRGELEVDITCLTFTAADSTLDSAFTAGQTQVAVDAR